jgi:phosphoglucomutase
MQNPDTRKEISTLLEQNNTAELETRLRNRIEFGTAGTGSFAPSGFRWISLTLVLTGRSTSFSTVANYL